VCSPPAQWMSGNGVHIFSIMITFYAIYNPIKSAFTVNTGATLRTHPPTHHAHAAAGPPALLGQLAPPLVTPPPSLSAFVRFEDAKMSVADKTSLFGYKVMFVLMNLLAMSGALYKMSLMGLLPTTASDWVGFISVPPAAQVATGSVIG